MATSEKSISARSVSPRARSRFRRPMSQSTHSTRLPLWASAAPTPAVREVFPVPPLPDTTAIHCPLTAPLPSSLYYNGFFLIFANGLGYFFGVSATFFMKMTRWVTSVPGIR